MKRKIYHEHKTFDPAQAQKNTLCHTIFHLRK